MRCAVADASALRWLRARADRVAHAHIDCTGAPLVSLYAAHDLSCALPATRLDINSALFHDIMLQLSREAAPMVALLKRHVAARLGGATRQDVRALDDEMLSKHGFDTDHDGYARASFAWQCDNVIEAGARGQLKVVLHMWQSADSPRAELRFDVSRRSNNDLLERTPQMTGDESTTDWWLMAATLYMAVKQYEDWPHEDADKSEFDDSDDDDVDVDDIYDDDDSFSD